MPESWAVVVGMLQLPKCTSGVYKVLNVPLPISYQGILHDAYAYGRLFRITARLIPDAAMQKHTDLVIDSVVGSDCIGPCQHPCKGKRYMWRLIRLVFLSKRMNTTYLRGRGVLNSWQGFAALFLHAANPCIHVRHNIAGCWSSSAFLAVPVLVQMALC